MPADRGLDGREGRGRLGQERAASPPARRAPAIVLVDPRGMGKTSPKGESGRNPSPFGRDWKDAYIALAIGRPLLGQRVADLLSMLEGLAAESGRSGAQGVPSRGRRRGRPGRAARCPAR